MHRALFGRLAALLVLASLTKAQAQEPAEIRGTWFCHNFCSVWDSPSTITIDGEYAVCKNERGDLSKGRLLTKRSVSCFGLVGKLADDNKSIEWSDGNIWRRRNVVAF